MLTLITDGLSIPFFSVGRHTLTISRSAVDTPDWLLWVRRAPPQTGADHPALPDSANDTIAIREDSHREGQKHVEWPDLLVQTEPEPEDVKVNVNILFSLIVLHVILLIHICPCRAVPPSRR